MRRLLPIAALLACLIAPSPAAAAKNLELAVQDDAVLLNRIYSDSNLALQRTTELGATWIRVNLRWAASMPEAQARAKRKPRTVAWDFSRFDTLLRDAEARGLKVQVTLTGPAPAWATAGKKISG